MVEWDDMGDRTPALFEAALEAVPMPVLIHGDKTVLYANEAAVAALGGRDASDILGLELARIVHPDGAEAGTTRRTLVFEHGHTVTGAPVKLIGVDGITRHAVVNGTPIDYSGLRAIMVTATLVRMSPDGETDTQPA